MDIQELIRNVQQGDPNSFEPIIREQQQKVFAYCYFMMGNKQEAEDAVQDIFFKAYQHLGAYRYDLSFQAWLFKIAVNHCHSLLRRKSKWNLLLPKFRSQDTEKSAEQTYAEQIGEDLAQWLEGLNYGEKQILILRVVEDYSFDEIARMLGENAATVRKRFERLKKKLRTNKALWEDASYEKRYGV